MKVICTWCKLDMGEKEPLDDPKIFHGQCGRCQKEMEMEHYEMSQRSIANQIRSINFKGAVYELACFLLTLGVILVATLMISSLIPIGE